MNLHVCITKGIEYNSSPSWNCMCMYVWPCGEIVLEYDNVELCKIVKKSVELTQNSKVARNHCVNSINTQTLPIGNVRPSVS